MSSVHVFLDAVLAKEVTEILLFAVTPTLAVHVDFHADKELLLPFYVLVW